MTYPQEVAYVPLSKFVLWMADGWQFVDWIVEPMPGKHGDFSCLMWRPL